jgi:hypothetical protein
MAAGESNICEICKRGHVTKRTEEMAFRQWSDKGYIQCRVTILVGTCDDCRVKSLDLRQDLGRSFPTGIRQAPVIADR